MRPYFEDDRCALFHGDCRDCMAEMPASSVDSIITDAPYGLSFMGKAWDHGVPGVPFWIEALRVAKPGAIMFAFGGTRTFHRLACAIEDAGWEIRDTIMWVYAQGFPKSLNFGCKCRGNALPYDHAQHSESEAEHDLRPVSCGDVSPTVDAGGQRREVLLPGMSEQGTPTHGQASDKSGHAGEGESGVEGRELHRTGEGLPDDSDAEPCQSPRERIRAGAHHSRGEGVGSGARSGRGGSPQERETSGQPSVESGGLRGSQLALDSASHAIGGRCEDCGGVKAFAGYGTSLKPSWEPILVAMKPCDGTFAENAIEHGVAGINVDGCRVDGPGWTKADGNSGAGFKDGKFCGSMGRGMPTQVGGERASTQGRWPANLIHDGSEEVVAMFPETTSGAVQPGTQRTRVSTYGMPSVRATPARDASSGSAARFFYTAKASQSERGDGCAHPTVKPLALMRYLCRLSKTPKGGVVLDPFCGSGSTGVAALREGRSFIGIEQESEYIDLARRRLTDAGPLFADTST